MPRVPVYALACVAACASPPRHAHTPAEAAPAPEPVASEPAPPERHDVEVNGPADPVRVQAKPQAAFAIRVRACYRDALRRDSSVRGPVAIDVDIAPDGAVTNVAVDGFDRDLDDCIRDVVRSLRWEPYDQELVLTAAQRSHLRIPLVLSP